VFSTSGLPLLLPCGVPFLLGAFSFNFWRLRAPSLISPPEPAPPSVSLPDPPPRGRLAGTLDVLRVRLGCGAEDEGGSVGELEREGGLSVLLVCTCGCDDDVGECFFFGFLRDDSLPLASELSGEPDRLRFVDDDEGFSRSPFFEGRCDDVLVPFEGLPEVAFNFELRSFSGVALLSSAFLRSSSFSNSVSVLSDSL